MALLRFRRSPACVLPVLTALLASTSACDHLLDGSAPDPDGLGERTAELQRRWPAATPTAPELLARLDATGWTDAEVTAELACPGAGTLAVRLNPVTGSLTASLRHDHAHPAAITALSLDWTAARTTSGISVASATPTPAARTAAIATRATHHIGATHRIGATSVIGATASIAATSAPSTTITSTHAMTIRLPSTITAGRPLAGALRVEAEGANAATWTLTYDVPTREAALAHAWWERTGVEVEELDELIREFGWLVDEAERAPRASSSAAFLAVFDRLKARRAHLTRAAPPWPAITLGCPVATPPT